MSMEMSGEKMAPPSASADPPRLSVVMPMYNDAADLPACLDSVLGQGIPSMEVIVVDDASTDDSAAVAAGYVARDNRVRLVRHEKNANSFQSRLTAFELVRGRHIFCCDADDIIPPGSFTRLLDRAAATGADVVHGRMRYYSDGKPAELLHWMHPFRVKTGEDFVLSMLNNARGWSVVGKLFARRVLDKALPTFPRGRHWFSLDDLLASCLLGLQAESYAPLDVVTYLYRVPPVTHSTRAGGFEKWAGDTLGIMSFFQDTVAASRGPGPLLDGVRDYTRHCIAGLLAFSAREPESFPGTVEKVKASVAPEHARWAGEQGLFTLDGALRRGRAGRFARLCASAGWALRRGAYETWLRLPIRRLNREMERRRGGGGGGL